MKKITLQTFALLLMLFFTFKTKAQAPAQCTDVMLQAFYWDSYTDSKWTNLSANASDISANFDMVWLPPSGNANGNGMGYLPVYYFDQNSKFGTQTELKSLISILKENGTRCMADIVVNHRNGVSNWTNFPIETYNGVTYSWGTWAICNTDEVKNAAGQATPTGAVDTGEDFDGGRDIDHTNVTVRSTIKDYMSFLKNEIGYDGWRWDMTKGFSASYVGEYCDAAGAYLSVGEFWDADYDRLNNWINGTGKKSTTFDFSLKYKINEAFAGNDLTKLCWLYNGANQPAGLIHHPNTKRYAVTFIDNHDTGRSDNSSRFTGNILAANALILSSPGIPNIWYSHWLANKTKISEMIQARKAVKIHSESSVVVNNLASNLYVATSTGLNGTLIVKIGSGSYNAPIGYTLATSGTDYAIWIKPTGAVAPIIYVSPGGGFYNGGTSVTLTSTQDASIYYTLNGTTPTASSTLYFTPIQINTNNTVLKAIAIGTQGLNSKIASYSYITSVATSIKVSFKAPASWTSAKVYVWENTSTALAGSWPGTPVNKDQDGFYTYTITNHTVPKVNFIFNNGSGTEQTDDLSTYSDGCWEYGAQSGNKYIGVRITCLSTGINNLDENLWKLYPNPTNQLLNVEMNSRITKIRVYNTLGIEINVETNYKQDKAETNISHIPQGLYFISVEVENGQTKSKLIMKL